ncbi:MAG: FG-GAP-like repeat-containing protein [Candidatus Cloacimonetes bacterium]|nr:FG-GAP-like repeat-containing protein [Candidatus Cloacimonadota bacterium]
MKLWIAILLGIFCIGMLAAQPWEADNSVFNPSGIPSLTFSQPRFADLDGDGDMDFLLGNTNTAPLFAKNTGSSGVPHFAISTNICAGISSLAAEVGVCADMDADGDLDLVTGGYTGLHLFINTGSVTTPVFEEQVGYFSGVLAGSYPVPDVADVDNDGDMDMVLGLSENGAVLLYLNTGSPSNGNFSELNMQILGDVGLYAYPVFCDLDMDGDQDILVGRDGHGFSYYQNMGTASDADWQENNALFANLGLQSYWNSPDLVDLNGDGLYDLVHGTASGPLQYYINTGTLTSPVWAANTSLFGGVLDVGGASSPVFYDFDNDGDLDMISGSQMGDIKYFQNTGNIHAPAWVENSAYFASIDHSIYSAVAIGDLNGDNLPDAIIGDLNGSLYFHRNTGTGFVEETGVLPLIDVGDWSVPRLFDRDGDGDLDLATGCDAGTMRYYRNRGTLTVPNFVEMTNTFPGIDVGIDCVPSFGDIDRDGDWDFVAGNLTGNLVCYTWEGTGWVANTSFASGISTDQNAAPALVDLDADGDLDIVLGDYDGTFSYYRNLMYSGSVLNPPLNLIADIGQEVLLFWENPLEGSTSPFVQYNVYVDGLFAGSTTEMIWSLSGVTPFTSYTVQVTAEYVAGESVPVELIVTTTANEDIVQVSSHLQNYPNPFNPSTTISFSVNNGSSASLEIYNLKGQHVRGWSGFASGKHSVIWDGCDEMGRLAGSGVYLYRLQSGNNSQMRKMLMMK